MSLFTVVFYLGNGVIKRNHVLFFCYGDETAVILKTENLLLGPGVGDYDEMNSAARFASLEMLPPMAG